MLVSSAEKPLGWLVGWLFGCSIVRLLAAASSTRYTTLPQGQVDKGGRQEGAIGRWVVVSVFTMGLDLDRHVAAGNQSYALVWWMDMFPTDTVCIHQYVVRFVATT